MPPSTKPPRTRQPHYIRAWRQHRGLTQEQLSEILDISTPHLSRIGCAVRPYTQDILEGVAEALSVLPADLLAVDPGKEAGHHLIA